MDKFRTRVFATKLCGLLMCAVAFASRSTRVMSRNTYQFAQTQGLNTSGNVLTDTECTFVFTLGEKPSMIKTQLSSQSPSWPKEVRLISSKLLPAEGGAALTVILTIKKPGDYTLPPVALTVWGREHLIAFPPLHAVQNPATAIPFLTLVAEDMESRKKVTVSPSTDISQSMLTVQVGSKVYLTISPKYTAKMEKVYWTVPKDAIMQEQIASFSPLPIKPNTDEALTDTDRMAGKDTSPPYKDNETSFLWQPLEAGQALLPVITCDVVALSGKSVTLATPAVIVTVLPAKIDETDNERNEYIEIDHNIENSLFPHAFSVGEKDIEEKTSISSGNIDATNANSSALLAVTAHIAKSSAIRKAARRTMILCIVLFVLFATGAGMGIKLKKKTSAAISAFLSFSFLLLAILCRIVLLSTIGVFTGRVIHAIPNKNSLSTSLKLGTIVRILDETPEYLYVKCGTIEGWAFCSDVVVIR